MFNKILERKLFKIEIKRIRLDAKEFRLRLKKAKRTNDWGAFFDWWDEREQQKGSNL